MKEKLTIKKEDRKYLWLLLGWVWYFIMYALTEKLIPEENCHVIHCAVDDMIPFCEYFVIAYCFWYLYVAGSLAHFLFTDMKSFVGLQKFIITTQVLAMVVYILWPSVQYMRPESFGHENFCTWILSIIYAFDTPTGILPSLHVGYSMGIVSTWLKKKDAKTWGKVFVTAAGLIICVSVMFVKQHSFLDVIAAIPVGIAGEIVAYGGWWKEKFKNKKQG